jgi:hypothetical protein
LSGAEAQDDAAIGAEGIEAAIPIKVKRWAIIRATRLTLALAPIAVRAQSASPVSPPQGWNA